MTTSTLPPENVPYLWEVKTADAVRAGTDANIFLSLEGDLGKLPRTRIKDSSSSNNFERGDINRGRFFSPDLGSLRGGRLFTDKANAGSDWKVDYVKITNATDGRVWTCQLGGQWIEEDGSGELALSFGERGELQSVEQIQPPAAAYSRTARGWSSFERGKRYGDEASSSTERVPAPRPETKSAPPALQPKIGQLAPREFEVAYIVDGAFVRDGAYRQDELKAVFVRLFGDDLQPYVWRPGWDDWELVARPHAAE